MWVVFQTYKTASGELSDFYEVVENQDQARARARQLATRDAVYAWGIAPIVFASESHWGGAL